MDCQDLRELMDWTFVGYNYTSANIHKHNIW